MESPDQLLGRLDRMGEERVRALLGRKYFEPKTVPLVKGWLSKQEQERRGSGNRVDVLDVGEVLEQVREVARHASEAAVKAQECATQAGETARRTQRFAVIAIAVGSAGLLVSVLALFALAIR